jgi:hypothetical protein
MDIVQDEWIVNKRSCAATLNNREHKKVPNKILLAVNRNAMAT